MDGFSKCAATIALSYVVTLTTQAVTFGDAASNAGFDAGSTEIEINGQLVQPADKIDSLTGVDTYAAAQVIVINNHSLATIDAQAFSSNINLLVLVLDGNPLDSITNAFPALPLAELSFNTVDIASSLTSIPDDLFSNLTSLRQLDFSGNEITSFAPAQFTGLTQLEILQFSRNDIATLSPTQFQGLTQLLTLNFRGNASLSSISENQFSGLSLLEVLEMGECDISTLSSNVFADLTSLTRLDIDKNSIERLPPNLFSTTTSLRTLNMDTNGMQVLDMTGANLPALNAFNVSNNALVEVNYEDAVLTQSTFNEVFSTGNVNNVYARRNDIDCISFNGTDLTGLNLSVLDSYTGGSGLDLNLRNSGLDQTGLEAVIDSLTAFQNGGTVRVGNDADDEATNDALVNALQAEYPNLRVLGINKYRLVELGSMPLGFGIEMTDANSYSITPDWDEWLVRNFIDFNDVNDPNRKFIVRAIMAPLATTGWEDVGTSFSFAERPENLTWASVAGLFFLRLEEVEENG